MFYVQFQFRGTVRMTVTNYNNETVIFDTREQAQKFIQSMLNIARYRGNKPADYYIMEVHGD